MSPARCLAGEIECQMLRWGADVQPPRGNLLVARSFVRLHSDRGSSRS